MGRRVARVLTAQLSVGPLFPLCLPAAPPPTRFSVGSEFVRSIVVGGMDGILTSVGIVASIFGADLSAKVGWQFKFPPRRQPSLPSVSSSRADGQWTLVPRRARPQRHPHPTLPCSQPCRVVVALFLCCPLICQFLCKKSRCATFHCQWHGPGSPQALPPRLSHPPLRSPLIAAGRGVAGLLQRYCRWHRHGSG